MVITNHNEVIMKRELDRHGKYNVITYSTVVAALELLNLSVDLIMLVAVVETQVNGCVVVV